MSASVSIAGALSAAANGSHRRIPCFSLLPFDRRRFRSFTSCTSRNAHVVRATTAGEDGPDGSQKAPQSSSASTAAPKGENIRGVGFGSGTSGDGGGKGSKKSRVVRRVPVQKPLIQSGTTATVTEKDDGGALPEQEKAFLIVWLGLGLLILLEGIILAASGFLPEEWDKLFVKYLYPSFTPTVVLFLGGTVAYGVLKYLKAGQDKS